MLQETVARQSPSSGSRPVPIGSRFIGVSLQPVQSGLGYMLERTTLRVNSGCRSTSPSVWVRAVALIVSAANGSVISTLRAR
jgi:hypothetical protein